jgi:hypothetical protein
MGKGRDLRIRLGKSEYVVSGPLVETFRPVKPPPPNRTWADKLLGLPIVNLFVPQPMPLPPGGGKYFFWGEREIAWSTLMDTPIPGPQSTLLSVGNRVALE